MNERNVEALRAILRSRIAPSALSDIECEWMAQDLANAGALMPDALTEQDESAVARAYRGDRDFITDCIAFVGEEARVVSGRAALAEVLRRIATGETADGT